MSGVMAVAVANCNSLEMLILGMMQIDDEFTASLSKIATNLKTLSVSSSNMTDKGLKALAGENDRY